MKILIVEDNSDFLDQAIRHLDGHHISKAETLIDGLAKIRNGGLDLLISDWFLKNDHSETSQEIIEIALENGIRTIIETSSPEDEDLDIFRDRVRIVDKLDFWNEIKGLVEGPRRKDRER